MEDGESPLIGLIIILGFITLHAVITCFITALERVNDGQIEKLIKNESEHPHGRRRALWLKNIVARQEETIFSLQLLITGICIAAGLYEIRFLNTYNMNQFFRAVSLKDGKPLAYFVVALLLMILFTAFGSIAPQKIASRRTDSILYRFAAVVRLVLFLMTPVLFICNGISNILLRIVRIDPHENIADVTEDEIKSVVKEGHEQGILKENEAKMIHNIIEFSDKDAKDIMTHRKNIVAVDGKTILKEALDFMLLKNNTRFPVYEEDMDNITGIIHIKDAMIRSQNSGLLQSRLCDIAGLIREIDFIPETRSLNTLFIAMQSQKSQMVIVVDEYGQTAGLVAMEDLLEEIVGNILDEYDEDETMILTEEDGSYLMSGLAPLDEICELLDISADIDQFDTLNGYLVSLIDKIPSDRELFDVCAEGYLFEVKEVKNKIIQTVRVKRLPQSLLEEKPLDTCDEKKYVIE